MFWFEASHPGTGEPLEVEAWYDPARRGARDRDGVPLEPDEPPEVVIAKVWNRGGEAVGFADFEEHLQETGLMAIRTNRKRKPRSLFQR